MVINPFVVWFPSNGIRDSQSATIGFDDSHEVPGRGVLCEGPRLHHGQLLLPAAPRRLESEPSASESRHRMIGVI